MGRELAEQHAADTQCQAKVEQGERQVEDGVVGDADAHHGGHDDGGVAEDHGQDKAESDGVEGRIAPGMAGTEGAGQAEQAAEGQPAVAAEQAGGDEARQAVQADVAPGDVVDEQPEGKQQTAQAEAAQPGVVECCHKAGADEQDDNADEAMAGRFWGRQKTRQFQALAGNGQDQEKQPGGRRGDRVAGAEPDQRASQPAGCAKQQDFAVQGRLALVGNMAGQHQQAGRHGIQADGDGRPAQKQKNAAQARNERGAVGPAAPEGDGPFEADHGAEKGRDHQGAVDTGRLRGKCRDRPAEPGQAG